jgi:exopolysaccharide biosynthesis polyprenyl glycosylphosphotransferase
MLGDFLALAAAWGSLAAIHPLTGPAVISAAIAVACTMMVLARVGLYLSRVSAVRSVEVARVMGSCLVGAGAYALAQWLAGSLSPLNPVFGAVLATTLILLLRWRFARWLKAKRLTGQYLRPVILVGTNQDASALWSMLNEEPELGYRIVAVIGPPSIRAPWKGLPSSVHVTDLGPLAARVGATGVMIVVSGLEADLRSTAMQHALASHLHVQLWTGISDVSNRRLRTVPVSGVPFLYVEPRKVAAWQPVAKRAMDVLIASATCLLTSPLMVCAALLIKLEDGGPVIYRHRVVGRHGTPITVFKLRTMVPNASQMLGAVASINERVGGPLFKATDDPRVTKVGRFLRATSIDELPQLWNVLGGTMSLVGPRCALPAEVERFDHELQRSRQIMRPGITGLWQSESRDNPSFSPYRRLDLFYVENWSISLDISILVNTVHGVSTRAFRALHKASPRKSVEALPSAPVQPGVDPERAAQPVS